MFTVYWNLVSFFHGKEPQNGNESFAKEKFAEVSLYKSASLLCHSPCGSWDLKMCHKELLTTQYGSLFQRTLGKLVNSQCAQCAPNNQHSLSLQRAILKYTNPVLSHLKEGFIMLPRKQSLLFLLHNTNKWNNMPKFCFTQQIESNMPEFKTVNTIYVLQSSVLNLPRSTETSPVDHDFSSTNT